MDEFLARFSGENGMLRRYLAACTALVVLAVLAAQGLAALVDAAGGQPIPEIAKAGTTRTYTVTRSVLDDPATTASIPRPAGQRIDPCGK